MLQTDDFLALKVEPDPPLGNFTITLTLSDNNKNGTKSSKYNIELTIFESIATWNLNSTSTNATSNSSLLANQTTETIVYDPEWSYDIGMSIISIDNVGKVVVDLSQEIVPPEDLSKIDKTVLDLIILTENTDYMDKLNFEWSVSEFNST